MIRNCCGLQVSYQLYAAEAYSAGTWKAVMSEPPVSRAFRGRKRSDAQPTRLPPGQHLTSDFPVLSAGPTPQLKLETWSFALQQGGSLLGKWSWAEFEALPQTRVKVDIHCVTSWSKLDTNWQGVTIDTLLEAAGLSSPPA
jgi:DMSO/TMAO reductase YedYZ molybdopterin-dependent catalytic subunit